MITQFQTSLLIWEEINYNFIIILLTYVAFICIFDLLTNTKSSSSKATTLIRTCGHCQNKFGFSISFVRNSYITETPQNQVIQD